VDLTRLSVYDSHFSRAWGGIENLPLLVTATVSAFLGAFIGSRLMKKVTMRAIQIMVVVIHFVMAFGLSLGLVWWKGGLSLWGAKSLEQIFRW
jgi:uncharacterized membrane protein YfcA